MPIRFVALFAAWICLFSTVTAAPFDSSQFNANKGPLRILRITPSGEKAPAGRQVVIQFNRPVVPVGRMERRADEIPVNIIPKLECEWRWLNTAALACQLGDKKGLKPATKYTVVVKPGIKTEDGKTIVRDYNHTFVTERPRVRYTRFKRWQGPDTPQIIVQFNQVVKRESVAAHMFIQTADGRRIKLNVEEDPAVREARERARNKGKNWFQRA